MLLSNVSAPLLSCMLRLVQYHRILRRGHQWQNKEVVFLLLTLYLPNRTFLKRCRLPWRLNCNRRKNATVTLWKHPSPPDTECSRGYRAKVASVQQLRASSSSIIVNQAASHSLLLLLLLPQSRKGASRIASWLAVLSATMAVNLSKNGPALTAAFKEVVDERSSTNW